MASVVLTNAELCTAAASDAAALSRLYTAVFSGNAAYAYASACKTHADTLRFLLWLFHRRAAMLLSASCPFLLATAPGADRHIIGAVAILPFSKKPSIFQMIKLGLLAWPFLWGFRSLWRSLQLDATLKEVTRPTGPHGHLQAVGELTMMGVDPEQQKQGIGDHLLSAILKQWDQSERGGGLVLTTQVPYAPRFYARHGFVELDVQTHHAQGGYQNWVMYRPRQ